LSEEGKGGRMSAGKQTSFLRGGRRTCMNLLAPENKSRRIPFCLYTAMQSKFCPSIKAAYTPPCLEVLYAHLLIVPMTQNFLRYSHIFLLALHVFPLFTVYCF